MLRIHVLFHPGLLLLAFVLGAVLALGGCADQAQAPTPGNAGAPDPGGEQDETSGDGDGDFGGDGDGEPGDGDGDDIAPPVDGDVFAGEPSESGGGGGSGDGDGDVEPEPEPEIPAGQLTAGEWNDHDEWDFWVNLFRAPEQGSEQNDPIDPDGDDPDTDSEDDEPEVDIGGPFYANGERWSLMATERVTVTVQAGQGPLADASATLLSEEGEVLARGRTDIDGVVQLVGQGLGDGLTVVVERDGDEASASVAAGDAVTLSLDAAPPSKALDVMFVVDTTGSMGDELVYLQAELEDVIDRVHAEAEDLVALRLSVNFYRDEGDDYLINSHPFTTDADEALDAMAAESANGGGDWPEAVEVALADGVQGHDWSEDARARLLFLVLDAPPHHTDDNIEQIVEVTREAAAQGIRVIPVAASGIDKDTEVLLRQLAVHTGGTYTFLTDHSGIGGAHLEPTVGEYEVEFLNDLLVRLISEAVQ